MIAFIGDSITEGWLKQGKRVWDRVFAPLGAVNRGVWGDDCARVLTRIANGALDGLDPHTAVILIGTNDIPWDPPRDEPSPIPDLVVSRVGQVVEAVRAKLPRARLVLHGILPRGEETDYSRVLVPRVNAGLARLPGVTFVDLGHVFLSGDVLPLNLMYDTLHLTEEAYRRWADALLISLDKLRA